MSGIYIDAPTMPNVLAAIDLSSRGEHVSDGLIARGCDELDAGCRRGDHFRVEDGRCVWCGREVDHA